RLTSRAIILLANVRDHRPPRPDLSKFQNSKALVPSANGGSVQRSGSAAISLEEFDTSACVRLEGVFADAQNPNLGVGNHTPLSPRIHDLAAVRVPTFRDFDDRVAGARVKAFERTDPTVMRGTCLKIR